MVSLLNIKDLTVKIDKKIIINSFNININVNEIHVIMGPNGSGKSTLINTIAGYDKCSIISGEIIFNGYNLLNYSIDERARMGLFVAFQYPIEINGVTWLNFFKAITNSQYYYKGLINTKKLLQKINFYTKKLNIKKNFLTRYVNEDFSGGEKKKLEVLQIMLFKPRLIILDEIDSGLDIDSIKNVAKNIKNCLNNKTSILLITHYKRILNIIKPNYVHIFYNGKIIKSSSSQLASSIEKYGYNKYINK